MKRTHDQKWLEENALFGCKNEACAENVSFPAISLYIAPCGGPICEECADEEGLNLKDLPPFNPFETGE